MEIERGTGRRLAGKWIRLAVVAIIVLGGIGAWRLLWRPTPEQVVKGFLDASQRRDTEVAKSYLSAHSLKMTSKSGGKVSPTFVGSGGDHRYTVGKATVSGSEATVPVKMQLPGGPGSPMGGRDFEMPFVTVNEDGKWKVDLAKTMGAMLGAIMKESMKGMMTSPGGVRGPGGTRGMGGGAGPGGRGGMRGIPGTPQPAGE